jgi:hypothetical protein
MQGPEKTLRMDSMLARLALPALTVLAMAATPAAALETNCRVIQARPEREACYKRQEEELAARRKPAPSSEATTLEPLRQMRQDDDAVYRSMQGICRGC